MEPSAAFEESVGEDPVEEDPEAAVGALGAVAVGAVPLGRERLVGAPADIAPGLLGAVLVRQHGDVGCSEGAAGAAERRGDGVVTARVVEVEAYAGPGEDPGSHAHAGPRPRARTMFGEPGRLYVYRSYGVHWCANVVVHDGRDGAAGAVLLRAAAVLTGRSLVVSRRTSARSEAELARGPGLLCAALDIRGCHDGTDVCDASSPVLLLPGRAPERIGCGPRVGVSGAGAPTPWRWWDPDSPCVSRYRPAARRRGRRTTPPGGDAGTPEDGADQRT